MNSPSNSTASSQEVTLPLIPELFDPNFLNVLLPPKKGDDLVAISTQVSAVANPMMDALQKTAHQTFTDNGAPAYSSTLSPTLDAFMGVDSAASPETINDLLNKSWRSDPDLTLRIIWNLRSIPDGKGDKDLFFRYDLYMCICLRSSETHCLLEHLAGCMSITLALLSII